MMLKLMKIEWMKIKRYKTFWILFALFMMLSALANYIGINIMNKVSEGSMNMVSQSFSFPSAWDYVSYVQSWFVIFLCFYVIISIANEFTYKTHRQHVIDGLSRLDFLHAKCFLILGISLVATLFFIVLAFIVGGMHGGGNPILHSEKIFYFFLYTLNYCLFAALITFFVRKTGLAIIVFFAYFIIEGIFSSVINMQTQSMYGNLMPLQCSDELLPNAATEKLGSLVGMNIPKIPIPLLIGTTLAYLTLYYFLLRKKITSFDL